MMLAPWVMVCAAGLAVYSASAPHFGIEQYPVGTNLCYFSEGEGRVHPTKVIVCEFDRLENCGIIARSPDFVSTLACIAANPNMCTLTYSHGQNKMELSCSCNSQVCNAFNEEIRNHLINFYAYFPKNLSTAYVSDYTDVFFKNIGKKAPTTYSEVALDRKELYLNNDEPIEISDEANSVGFVNRKYVIESREPRAEALKDAISSPTSDDEDDTEGSGAGAGVVHVYGSAPGQGATSAPNSSRVPPAHHAAAAPFLFRTSFVTFFLTTTLLFI